MEYKDNRNGPEQAAESGLDPEALEMDLTAVRVDAKKVYSRLGFGFAALVVVTYLVQGAVVLAAARGIVPIDLKNPNVTMLISVGAMYAVGFPVCYFFCRGMERSVPLQKTKWGAGRLAVAFLICLGVLYVGNLIGQMLMAVVSILSGKPLMNQLWMMLHNVNPLLVFCATVLVAPVVEELLFRKLLIDRTVRYGQGISIVLSGTVFGLAHGNFYQFFYACAVGMVFAFVYIKTGRLRYTIAFHMIINFLGSIIPMAMLKGLSSNAIITGLATLTYMLLVVGCAMAGTILVIVYRKQIFLDPEPNQIPKGSRLRTVCLNVGIPLYVVLCIGVFIMGIKG